MIKLKINNRTHNPAYIDLSGSLPNANFDDTGFMRIGDRAACYIKILEWRNKNPERKLTIVDNPFFFNPQAAPNIAKNINASWMFKDIADEIHYSFFTGELISPPLGENLHDMKLWKYWYYLAQTEYDIKPNIKPPDHICQTMKKKIKFDNYVVVHPRLDSSYSTWRNFPLEFWNQLIYALNSKNVPVVIIGLPEEVTIERANPLVQIFYIQDTNIMESLAAIYNSKCLVGGETGTIFWSGIFKTPTVGIYPTIYPIDKESPDWLTIPLSFGGMVKVNKKEDAFAAANDALEIFFK